MSLYAVIRDDLVESVHEWDGRSSWVTPSGTRLRGPVPAGCTRGWILSADGLGVEPPPPPPTIETARAAALTEVAALAASRQAAGVLVEGVGVLGVHPDAERSWASLHGRVAVALRRGEDPDRVVFPVVFPGVDKAYVTLRTLEEADAVYAELYRVGAERQAQGEAAAYLVRRAATVEEIGVVLDGYRGPGGDVPGRPLPPS